ncbi:nitric oxide reductase activation protein NorD [Marinicella meishanensis]|uniref:nitric oxide reductase activation protein NorD n=1 Tax=Marinicella meishanensis TaxID=2873263 RepID=UPI001CBC1D20|nr:VWA domain-containing protein [Marinicella sp. NBU2979]
MEEWVGQKWHHYITRKSGHQCPDARVTLAEISGQLVVFFRALGGDAGLSIGHTSARPHDGHRTWLQKIAGSGKKSELAHFSGDHFYLPQQLDCFAHRRLNESLYFWLAAMGSFNRAPRVGQVLAHNQALTQQVLHIWPGLWPTYRELVAATLQQRPTIQQLPAAVQVAEQAIRQLLQAPTEPGPWHNDPPSMPQPVPLWLRPVDALHLRPHLRPLKRQSAEEDQPAELSSQDNQQQKRHQAKAADEPAEGDGFMSFRLESLFSWSEFINLDRSEDDDADEDALRVAEDLDHLSINSGPTRHKIRLDLDLPASEYDDELLTDGILLPEWDYRKNQYVPDHCSLQLMALKVTESAPWPAALKQQASRLRRQFETLKPVAVWHHRQPEGEEIDLNAYLAHQADRQRRHLSAEPLLYRQRVKNNRDLSTLILTDMSLSTDAHVNDEKKVIDVIKEAVYLLATSLDAAQERFAIAAFTSKKRSHVRYYPMKDFNESFDQACQDQIQSLKPAYYTRMGAAIRQASAQLQSQATQQKLLLLLTDGKPNDLDLYESRYGLEDTRQAIREARQKGLTPFCVSIDYQASDYLPYLFGHQGYIHLNNALDLPKKLPKLFFQLVQ